MDTATIIGGGDIAQQTAAMQGMTDLVNASLKRVFLDNYDAWLQNSAVKKSIGLPVEPKPPLPLTVHYAFIPGFGDKVTIGPDTICDYPKADPRISEVGKIDDVVGGLLPDGGGLRYNLSNMGVGEVHFPADGSIWQLVNDPRSLFGSHWKLLKGGA